ncbi:MAG: hypothetical protein PUC65_09670, partial [Clostridiales bacterium]|nr:hypothetical protein [Clostridiales bacterium]
LWALKKYKTSPSYGDPGMYSGKALKTNYTVDQVSSNVKYDLDKFKYSYKDVSSPMASLGKNESIIAVRTTTTSSPFSGRVFELEGGYSPSNVAWNIVGWNTNKSKRCVMYKKAYTSTM